MGPYFRSRYYFGSAECLHMLVIQQRFPNLSWKGNPWWACLLYTISPQPLDVKTQNVLYSLQIHISHNVLWYGFCPTCTSCSLYSLAAPWPYSLNNDPEVSQKGSNQDPHTEKKQLMTIKHRLLKLENNHTTHMMELYRIILKASCILSCILSTSQENKVIGHLESRRKKCVIKLNESLQKTCMFQYHMPGYGRWSNKTSGLVRIIIQH